MFSSQLFCSKSPVKINTCKVIGRIYKYDHRNWPYPYPNTTFAIPPRFDTSIQTQHNSASDASAGENYEASYGLDQSTNHYGNTDVNDNDDSKSFDTSWKNNCRSYYFGDTINTTATPQSSTLTPPGKIYLCFQI